MANECLKPCAWWGGGGSYIGKGKENIFFSVHMWSFRCFGETVGMSDVIPHLNINDSPCKERRCLIGAKHNSNLL